MNLEAYLFFPGNTEEAMHHYQGILEATCRSPVAAMSTRRRPRTRSPWSSTRRWTPNVHTAGERPGRRDERRPDQDRTDHRRTDEAGLRRIFDGLGEGGP